MQVVWDAIKSFWELIVYIVTNIRIVDILDILVIAFLIYKCIEFFSKTRGGQLVKGLLLLLVMAIIADWLDMVTVNFLMVRVMDSLLIAAVIIFHPEIRRVLERVGTSKLGLLGRGSATDSEEERISKCIDAACKAAGSMQEQKCGALMVFERTTQLGEIVATGTLIDAEATSPLIANVFFPKSPLHDGGMILRQGKVYAAGCILPLTQNTALNKELGTRHRAAIGMSENSDAVVVVVSEETGTISLAVNGELRRGFDAITLHNELSELLIDSSEANTGFFSRVMGIFGKKTTEEKEENNSKKK
ncbi:MAG: TIGR00159 family protein [Ruminococcaceae bacterium]|nr:TIGR00159 family protein [Oscillospiraceae bacterium]